MASIQDQIKNARTLEDVINLLTILFTNMNNQNNMYYDMFLNPEPLTLKLERYGEDGVLETVDINNRAKDRITTYSGQGDPNNVVTAAVGATYIDILNKAFYYKTESGTTGWYQLLSNYDFSEGEQFLAPDGSAVNLTNINMENAINTLAVKNGGTGVASITGIIKGNESAPFSPAVDGTDFLGPESTTGMVAYFAGSKDDLPKGWLICNGAEVSIADYNNLYKVIGNTYNGTNTTSGNFNLPNLLDGYNYIKCGEVAGSVVEENVGKHTHDYGGLNVVTYNSGAHSHGRGTQNITGIAGTSWMSKGSLQEPKNNDQITGCFFKIKKGEQVTGYDASGNPTKEANKNWSYYGVNDGSTSANDPGMGFSAALSWTGRTTQEGSHNHVLPQSTTTINNNIVSKEDKPSVETNEVRSITLIPIIKY